MLGLLLSSSVIADETEMFDFKIKSQRADKALIRFAKKVGMPILFPNEKIIGRYTNPLYGRHDLDSGIEILLAGTGLKALPGNTGQLHIEIFSEPEEEIMIRNSKKKGLLAPIASFFGAVLTAAPIVAVQAQSDGTDSRARIEEIIVTAQHRAQSIQDVPITVTAISADELEAGQIFDIGSIANNVPGMTLGEFSPGQALISAARCEFGG